MCDTWWKEGVSARRRRAAVGMGAVLLLPYLRLLAGPNHETQPLWATFKFTHIGAWEAVAVAALSTFFAMSLVLPEGLYIQVAAPLTYMSRLALALALALHCCAAAHSAPQGPGIAPTPLTSWACAAALDLGLLLSLLLGTRSASLIAAAEALFNGCCIAAAALLLLPLLAARHHHHYHQDQYPRPAHDTLCLHGAVRRLLLACLNLNLARRHHHHQQQQQQQPQLQQQEQEQLLLGEVVTAVAAAAAAAATAPAAAATVAAAAGEHCEHLRKMGEPEAADASAAVVDVAVGTEACAVRTEDGAAEAAAAEAAAAEVAAVAAKSATTAVEMDKGLYSGVPDDSPFSGVPFGSTVDVADGPEGSTRYTDTISSIIGSSSGGGGGSSIIIGSSSGGPDAFPTTSSADLWPSGGAARFHLSPGAAAVPRREMTDRSAAGAPVVAAARAAADRIAPTAVVACTSAPPEFPAKAVHPPLYRSRIVRKAVRMKIPWAEPEHLVPGFSQRLEALLSSNGMQLAGVYVEHGCVELTLFLEGTQWEGRRGEQGDKEEEEQRKQGDKSEEEQREQGDKSERVATRSSLEVRSSDVLEALGLRAPVGAGEVAPQLLWEQQEWLGGSVRAGGEGGDGAGVSATAGPRVRSLLPRVLLLPPSSVAVAVAAAAPVTVRAVLSWPHLERQQQQQQQQRAKGGGAAAPMPPPEVDVRVRSGGSLLPSRVRSARVAPAPIVASIPTSAAPDTDAPQYDAGATWYEYEIELLTLPARPGAVLVELSRLEDDDVAAAAPDRRRRHRRRRHRRNRHCCRAVVTVPLLATDDNAMAAELAAGWPGGGEGAAGMPDGGEGAAALDDLLLDAGAWAAAAASSALPSGSGGCIGGEHGGSVEGQNPSTAAGVASAATVWSVVAPALLSYANANGCVATAARIRASLACHHGSGGSSGLTDGACGALAAALPYTPSWWWRCSPPSTVSFAPLETTLGMTHGTAPPPTPLPVAPWLPWPASSSWASAPAYHQWHELEGLSTAAAAEGAAAGGAAGAVKGGKEE